MPEDPGDYAHLRALGGLPLARLCQAVALHTDQLQSLAQGLASLKARLDGLEKKEPPDGEGETLS